MAAKAKGEPDFAVGLNETFKTPTIPPYMRVKRNILFEPELSPMCEKVLTIYASSNIIPDYYILLKPKFFQSYEKLEKD